MLLWERSLHGHLYPHEVRPHFLCFNIYENVLFCFLLSGDVLTYFQISDSSSCKTEAFLVLLLTKSDYLVIAQLGTMCHWTWCSDHMINSYISNNTRNASVFTVTQFWTMSQWTVRTMNVVTLIFYAFFYSFQWFLEISFIFAGQLYFICEVNYFPVVICA